jgi:hypothetical protein
MSLLPQFDKASTNSSGALVPLPAASFLAANPRYCGMGTVTLSGTIVNGDVLTLKFTGSFIPTGSTSVSASLTGSDTLATAAQKLANAIIASAALQNFDVNAVVYSGVLIIVWAGPLGTNATMSMTKTGTGTEAAAFTQVTGGSGPIIPKSDVTINFNGQILSFPAGVPFLPSAPVLAALMQAACPIS